VIESPCIKVCTLDSTGELCLGCFRTLVEIGGWAGYSDPERWSVLERLPGRRREHEAMIEARSAASRCERCGASFACGALDPDKPCWCTAYPPVTPSGLEARCLCPACLRSASAS
jgi:predicted Fe-S protein YdhL (DUF1289 family)